MVSASDKIELVYEFNNESPLFARVAAKQLDLGNTSEALSILEKGIKYYPNYPTAYLIYAVALAVTGSKDEAKKIISDASGIINCTATTDYYLEKIDAIVVDHSLPPGKRASSFFVNEISDVSAKRITEEKETKGIPIEDTYDLDLEELAEKLSKASMPQSDEQTVKETLTDTDTFDDAIKPGKSLVSETLAKIYFNQGNLKEALAIYETLKEVNPAQSDYYQQKIELIRQRMK